ncbi:MAG: TetR/AcrR family transcriptional regulator [Acidimicrobiia bacterium]
MPNSLKRAPSTAPTARGRRRHDQLLDVTAELVAARGFHAVGIVDIGAAAGVSGSAIYRHFRNKQELLVALIDRVVDELLAGARAAVNGAADPAAALDALVRAHVAFALRDRAIIKVYSQESDHLPDEDRRRLRRKQHHYAEIWTDVVTALRTDYSNEEAAAAVHAVFGLLNSVADFTSRIDDDELAELLTNMALTSLRDARSPEQSGPRAVARRLT